MQVSVSKLRSLSASHNRFHSNSTRSYLPIFMYVAKKNVALTIPFPFPMYLVSKTQHRQLVLFVVRIIFSNHPDTFSTWIIRIRGSDIVANFNVSCLILLHQKFLQSDWLRAVVFQLNLKYLHVKITNLLRVVV